MRDYSAQKEMLLKRLAELDSRLHAIEAELDIPHSKDWEESAVEREGDEVLEALGTSGQQAVMRIRSALQRLRDEEFGVCVQCGDEISIERLNVVPDSAVCRNCAARISS